MEIATKLENITKDIHLCLPVAVNMLIDAVFLQEAQQLGILNGLLFSIYSWWQFLLVFFSYFILDALQKF